ncbi:MAG: hypothetical protein H7A51_17115 [Akkermansiaceae bacterium]|nr:hypothetical protein [Akkermansiaceae bacterium]
MKSFFRIRVFVIISLLSPLTAQAASELCFDGSGRVSALVLGGEHLLPSKSSSGFYLHNVRGGKNADVHLSEVETTGNKIKVSHPRGSPSFLFQVDTYPKHVAIHLLEARGIGNGRDHSLGLVIDAKQIAAYTLNDLMTVDTGGRRKKKLELQWPYLWGRPRPDGTRGSVVLYDDTLRGGARDAVLAEIWSAQSQAGHMVRPAGRKTWTEADVMAWVDQWVKKFSTIAKVSVAAENLEDLYAMTEAYVIPSGANRVYMFTKDWRVGGQSMVAVDPRVFPNGKADLRAYSDYLAARGIHLQLKSLSPQIDKYYKKYISPTVVDKRIMCWASGKLVEAIDPDATTVRFRVEKEYLDKRDEVFMRVGNEIIRAKKTTYGKDGVWVLEKCSRGYGGSTAKAHQAGAEMAGCVEVNGSFNFEDDFGQPDSLAEEICGEYGDFLNEMNVGHLHFDGTGRMGQYPWYVRDFTDYVYSRVDQPVTGSRVGGNLPANFEHQFSAARAISGAIGYRDIRVGPRLHQKGRKHTEYAVSMLDLHFDVMDGITMGSRRASLLGGQSGASLSLDTLKSYGLTGHAFQLFKHWVELAPVFDDADAEFVAGFLTKNGHHYQGEDVLVLGKNADGQFIYTPHRVMGRTTGKDAPFSIDQEWGAVPRFQHIRTGASMELLNPNEAQEPQVVIHVMEGAGALKDPLIKVDGGELAVKGIIEPNEYMKFEGGGAATVYDKNWNKLRSLPVVTKAFIFKKGSNSVTTTTAAGSNTPDLRVQYITLGPVYVLATNKHLKRPNR